MRAAQIKGVGALIAESGPDLLAVDRSIRLTDGAPDVVAAEIARFLELAAGWRSPLIRVFGGSGERDNAVRALRLAVRKAEQTGVRIGLETHDEFSSAAAVAAVLDTVDSPTVGAVWDIVHTNRVGEAAADGVARLGERILAGPIKDARRNHP